MKHLSNLQRRIGRNNFLQLFLKRVIYVCKAQLKWGIAIFSFFFCECKRFPQKIHQNPHLYLQVISQRNQRISLDLCQALQVCSCRLQFCFCFFALKTCQLQTTPGVLKKVWIPWATDAHAFDNEDSWGGEENVSASSSIFGCSNFCF